MKKIAIFISGTGSNAQRMMDRFYKHDDIQVSCLVSTKPNEEVAKTCNKLKINYIESGFGESDYEEVLQKLDELAIEWVVLAGFLKKIPPVILRQFPGRMINLHPSLLPKFGGKGMYGMHVHQAVIEAKEKESGITIHYVNENYDEGKIIAQITTPIHTSDDSTTLFKRIRQLEADHFPRVVEQELIING
jgi:phosphoribosylglycinamide formyltransferase-1